MDLQSLGHAAALYQRDPRSIRIALLTIQAQEAAEAGQEIPREVRPALTLNGVEHFHADEVVRAVGWLAERDARLAAEKVSLEAAGNG